ncbi:MAG: hypothetical protein NVS2B17_26090 [Candidatus Velthaea sp.]
MLSQPAAAVIYKGKPDLPLTAAMVAAGGGAHRFSSARLYAVMTGPLRAAETAKLKHRFGAAEVRRTFTVFDFAVTDALKIARAKHVVLPRPAPQPSNGKALALALYAAGRGPVEGFDVGYMLEHVVTHPIHHTIMRDLDAKFGARENAHFHVVLAQMMNDVAQAYGKAR